MSIKNFFLTLLTAFAAGTVAGIWLTSKKGTPINRKIRRRGEAFAEALDEKIDKQFNELLKVKNSPSENS